MKPNNQDIQREITRRRASNIGYQLLTDEEIIREIQNEKNPPAQEKSADIKPKKKKRRRPRFRPAYQFRQNY